MDMETLNVMQLTQLFVGYLGFTVGLPALVFYRKAKQFPAAVRFLIYFTIGNFYVINLVQVMELLHISYRITLSLFTFVPAILLIIKFYDIPVIAYINNVLDECRYYILRELGLKSFLMRRWKELRKFLNMIRRNGIRLIKENILDIPFLILFALLVWKVCGSGILHSWGYGASDVPVHNYWINGLVENNIYVAGIYPMGMHCMLYYLSEMMGIPVYVCLRLFWLIQFTMIALMILIFLKGHCKTRFLPWLGCMFFVGAKYFLSISYARYGAVLPQEFGMLYILPSVFWAMEFFKTRKHELETGVNRIRCASSWCLLGFAMAFSMTLTSHFYDTIITLILCLGIAIGYGFWFCRGEYFFRVILAGILGILMAFLPMAVAFLTGKSLQGSMYWAMNVLGLRDYTELIFKIICFGAVVITVGGILFLFRRIRSGKLSFENKKVPNHYILSKVLLQIVTLLMLAAICWVGWKYREIILWGCQQNVFSVADMDWVLYGIGAAILVGLVQRYLMDSLRGAGLFSIVIAEIILGLGLVSGSLGWPMLMEPYRAAVYVAYLIPVILVMTMEGAVNVLFLARLPGIQQALGFLLAALVLFHSTEYDWIRGSFGGGNLEMNEAILCTTNILNDNKSDNHKWTIVSANDELRMVEEFGRHTETIEFLEEMEAWNPSKELTIPTERVYFYIEKEPLNYADGYQGEIPVVSEEQAAQSLPENSGINAYTGLRRAVTMSRMYYWAEKFRELYPNEMKVYYENDRFVCYYIEQNEYRLYNFAIDYDYNTVNEEQKTE